MLTRTYEVNKKDIALLKFILEAYAHHAILRTLDPKVAIIELIIAEDYADVMQQVVESVREEYGISLNEITKENSEDNILAT